MTLHRSPFRSRSLRLCALAFAVAATAASGVTAADLARGAPAAQSTDNPALAAPAAESTARAALHAYLALWSADAPATRAEPFSADLVLRYAHGVPELNAEVQGRTSALHQTRAVARLGRHWQFTNVAVHPTLDANVYFANYTATGTSALDGSAVQSNVVLRLDVAGRQVVRLVEYANPAIRLAADAPAALAASR